MPRHTDLMFLVIHLSLLTAVYAAADGACWGGTYDSGTGERVKLPRRRSCTAQDRAALPGPSHVSRVHANCAHTLPRPTRVFNRNTSFCYFMVARWLRAHGPHQGDRRFVSLAMLCFKQMMGKRAKFVLWGQIRAAVPPFASTSRSRTSMSPSATSTTAHPATRPEKFTCMAPEESSVNASSAPQTATKVAATRNVSAATTRTGARTTRAPLATLGRAAPFASRAGSWAPRAANNAGRGLSS